MTQYNAKKELLDSGLWVDAEVHLFPPEWCLSSYTAPSSEKQILHSIYRHPEGRLALSLATVDPLLAEMKKARIAKSVIMGLPWADAGRCWRNNEYVKHLVEQYPDVFIGFGILPSPGSSDLKQAVRRIHEEFGFRGIKVIPSWHGYRLNDPELIPALDEMTERGMVLMPHTDHVFVTPDRADTAYALYEVARRHPNLKILAPHLAGLLCLYDLHEPVRESLQNMMFVTSVPASMRMVSMAVDVVGPYRVAFGTDYPFNSTHDQQTVRRSLEELGFSQETQKLIGIENVLRFLGEMQ